MNKFFKSVRFTPKKIILLSALVIILVNACKKEVVSIFADKNSNKAAVQWAKDYYQQSLLPKQANFMSIRGKTQMNTTGGSDNRIKEVFLNWELAGADATALYDFVEIPLKSNFISRSVFEVTKGPASKPAVDEKTLNAGFDRLIIYKNKENIINQRIVSYVPDKEYVNRHNGDISHNTIKDLDNDFFGYLEYKDWSGNTLFVLRIENGRSVKKLSNRISIAPITMQKMNAVPGNSRLMVLPVEEECVMVTQSHQERWCYYEIWGSEVTVTCDPWETIIDGQYQVCTNPNNPGGGGTPFFDDPIDCADPINFDRGECPKDIEDNLTDTCLKKALNLALNNDVKGEISSIFSNLNKNTNVKIKLFDDVSFTNGNPAATRNGVYRTNSFYIEILLNKDILKTSSTEFIVSTIMHEVLHAYFRKSTSLEEEFNGKDHNDMANQYVLPMANYLHDVFGISQFDATAIVWEGLKQTDAFQNSSTFDIGSGPTKTTATKSDIMSKAIEYYLRLNGNGKNPCN